MKALTVGLFVFSVSFVAKAVDYNVDIVCSTVGPLIQGTLSVPDQQDLTCEQDASLNLSYASNLKKPIALQFNGLDYEYGQNCPATARQLEFSGLNCDFRKLKSLYSLNANKVYVPASFAGVYEMDSFFLTSLTLYPLNDGGFTGNLGNDCSFKTQ